MTQTIGIGVIGMGWMGLVHSRAYRVIEDRFSDSGMRPRLVACADDVESRAEQGKRRMGFEQATTAWQQVIQNPDVQVVNVTTPNVFHLPMVTAAVAAGKHVFCEKPVGRSPHETATIAAAARVAGVISGVGYNYRWAPLVQYARQLISSGKLGQITHYRGRFLVGYGSHPDSVLSWRFQREVAGTGALGDLMSHVVDMAHMLAGPVEQVVSQQKTFIASRPQATPGEGTHFSVNAAGPRATVANEDYVSALARFESGAQGTFEVCRIINGPRCEMAFEVNATHGALKWNFERMNEIELVLSDDRSQPHPGSAVIQVGPEHPGYAHFYPGPGNSMSYEDLKALEMYHFLRRVTENAAGAPGLEDALAVAEVLAAMQQSWESGNWQGVQPLPVSS